MNPYVEKFVLKARAWCEMPSADGVPLCARQATHVVEMRSERWQYNMAICDDCADYLETIRKENTNARNNNTTRT